MERIKEALDRAKSSSGSHESPPGAKSHPPATGDNPGDIVYTQTRKFDVSPMGLAQRCVLTGEGSDPATRAVKMLRTQVMQRLTANEWNALAITSPGPGQGKSLTAVNLAISLSREVKHTVLLVDLDMQSPSIHTYFGYTPEYGLEDYLLNDVELPQILVNPGFERLVILPTRSRVSSSSELINSPRMLDLVEDLKTRYPSRIILFDLPPILQVDDALAFAPFVDAALLVIEDGATRREELERAIELLSRTRLLGTVLNKTQNNTMAEYY